MTQIYEKKKIEAFILKLFFGTIVANNAELVGKWISHYRQFGECYVVEGATEDWKSSLGWSGHNSTDGTVEIIRESGVPHTIATKPWRDKNHQCNEFMRHVPPDADVVWYADSDEFYTSEDIEWMKLFLSTNPDTTFASFNMYHWWKHKEYRCVGGDGWAYETPIPRLWRWFPGARFETHRPPTILRNGLDLSKAFPLDAKNNPVVARHYSYCFRQQVLDKLRYYSKVFGRDYMPWFRNVWETWTPENHIELENRLSVHPSCTGARTVHCPEIQHPIEVPWE